MAILTYRSEQENFALRLGQILVPFFFFFPFDKVPNIFNESGKESWIRRNVRFCHCSSDSNSPRLFFKNSALFSKERSVQIKHSPLRAWSKPAVSSAKPPGVPARGKACTQGCARTQHLKVHSSHLNTSRCPREKEDGTSWLLAARFQTAEWKTAVQEIKSFIPDPLHGIDIWYSKDSLDCMTAFNHYRNDGHCAPVKPRAALHTAHRTYFSHNLKYLRLQYVSTGNVSRWNYASRDLCCLLYYYRTWQLSAVWNKMRVFKREGR